MRRLHATIMGVHAVSGRRISANGGEVFWQPALLFITNICLLSVGFGCTIPPSSGIGVWTSATTSGIFVVPCCALACVHCLFSRRLLVLVVLLYKGNNSRWIVKYLHLSSPVLDGLSPRPCSADRGLQHEADGWSFCATVELKLSPPPLLL